MGAVSHLVPSEVPALIARVSGRRIEVAAALVSDPFAPFWGELAARYRLERLIGRGGMGCVYLAYELKHDRYVAVKVLLSELCNSVNSQRFLRELKIAASLQHPHILPVYDSGEAAGTLYYVMPYVAGHTVRERLFREVQFPVGEAVRIAREVASALAYAHHQGIIHRDIKPENILLSEGYAVVADFGIARALANAGGGLTTGGLALGTPPYMSPEQLGPEERLDGRSDLYSLGCVLYEMLAGQPPFTGPSAHAVLARHASDPVPSVRTVRAAVPESVEQAVLRALEKVPADRFANGEEFIRALGPHTESEWSDVPATTEPRKPSFFSELKRRRVYQAALLYATFAVGFVQVAPIVADTFGWPVWLNNALVISALAGFPITLVLSWTYDLTLRGFQRTVALPGVAAAMSPTPGGRVTRAGPGRTGRASAREPPAPVAGWWRLLPARVLAGIAGVGAIAGLVWVGFRTPPSSQLAVLPCSGVVEGAGAEHQYDVLTESLIGNLEQLPRLSVKSLAAVTSYRNSGLSALEIGRQLRVKAVLTCTVREADIRIEAIRVGDGARIWGELFERRPGSFDQDAIALDVADNLAVRLTSRDRASLEVYQLTRRARNYWNLRTAESLEKAVDLYEEALAKDPGFAPAQVGLANSYVVMPYFGGRPPREAYPLAERAAKAALKLDGSLADAHAALGLYRRDYEYDWEGAEEEFKRATTTGADVQSGSALQWYAELMTSVGRFEAAEQLIRRAELADPSSLPIRAVHGFILMCAGRAEEAKRQLQETLERDPGFHLPHWFLGQLYVQQGKYDSAVVRLQEAARLPGGATPRILADLAGAHALHGDSSAALAILDSLQQLGQNGAAVFPYERAVVHAGLGNHDVAITALESAKAERTWQITNLRIDPMLAPLRKHPRYEKLVASLGFPDE